MTARLKRHCAHFEVLRLSESWYNNEQHQLIRLLDDGMLFGREVLLCCDESPAVYAWTLIPETTIQATGHPLMQLADQPLGELLFKGSKARRERLQLATFAQHELPPKVLRHIKLQSSEPLWGRRSMLYYQQHPLLVHELFLPGMAAYKDNQ